jgi:hypothetical protein
VERRLATDLLIRIAVEALHTYITHPAIKKQQILITKNFPQPSIQISSSPKPFRMQQICSGTQSYGQSNPARSPGKRRLCIIIPS